jgi:DNA-binding transcriptional MocR family regulator
LSRDFRRTVIEVREDLHREIRRLALLNDLRIYQLANAIIEDFLKDEQRVKTLIKRLRLEVGNPLH